MEVEVADLDVGHRDGLPFAPRQCHQHPLLVAPCLLLDFSVLELADVHLPLSLPRPAGSTA
jgi:hypothetical protein